MPIQRLPVRDGGTVSMREHQQRMTEVGRIRLGVFNPEGKGRPEKLDRFRFTSTDSDLIVAVAEQYGGRPAEYSPQRSNGAIQWEVITEAREVLVYVPQQKIDPWMEKWKPGMCERRCDGVFETIGQQDCLCAARRVAPKDMCKPTVRVQLMLAEVPGIGTWRLESHGAYAAGELATLAPLVAALPMPCPAKLMLREESRSWMENGERKTNIFYVPWLHISAATPSQLMLGGDALTQALAASTARTIEAAPQQRAIEAASDTSPPACGASTPDGPCTLRAGHPVGPMYPGHEGHMAALASQARELPAASATPPATPSTSPTTSAATGPVRLSVDEQEVILRKIEDAPTVERLKEIAGKLVARGVKDEKVKQALQSKAADITAGEETAARREANRQHQAALKDTAVKATDPWAALDLRGMSREQFGEMTADPQWQECLDRGANPQAIINEGGPAHWLAGDDQARHYQGMPDGDPDVVYPVGTQVEVGGVTFTKHTSVEDFLNGPPPEEYDVDTEFALLYPAAGPFGWTTTQTNDWIKRFCGVEKVSQATGAQLHALRTAMKDHPEQFQS